MTLTHRDVRTRTAPAWNAVCRHLEDRYGLKVQESFVLEFSRWAVLYKVGNWSVETDLTVQALAEKYGVKIGVHEGRRLDGTTLQFLGMAPTDGAGLDPPPDWFDLRNGIGE